MPQLILSLQNQGQAGIWKRRWKDLQNSLPPPTTTPEKAVRLILGVRITDIPAQWAEFENICEDHPAPWYGQALHETGGQWPAVIFGSYFFYDGLIVASQWIPGWHPRGAESFPSPHLRPRFRRLDFNLRQMPEKWNDVSGNPHWPTARAHVIRLLADLWALFSAHTIPHQFYVEYKKQVEEEDSNTVTYEASLVAPQSNANATLLNIKKPLAFEPTKEPDGIAVITTLRPSSPSAPPGWSGAPSARYNHESEYLVVASPNYQSVLEQITRVFRIKSPKSILFVGPPGCGKEILFDLIAHGLGKRDGRKSVAGLTMDNAKESEKFEKFIKDHRTQTIVVDEVDKCKDNVRSWLLRILETDTLDEKNDLKGTTWVMAASRPVFELRREVKPLDFWTRIQFTIAVKQPLDVDQQHVREKVLRAYFQLFWGTLVADEQKDDPVTTWLKKHADFAAEAAADAVYDARRYDISVRELRAMTLHVFHELKSLHYEIGTGDLSTESNRAEHDRLRDAALRYLATVPL